MAGEYTGNELKNYNPLFYANEALIHLKNALGLANRVHRGFDEERRTFDLGDTITIKKPSIFEVKDAPSDAQDLHTEKVDIKLDRWKEVKFGLTDQELAYTSDRIINDHIMPASYALANEIDRKLATHLQEVKWSTAGTTVANTDGTVIPDMRELQFNAGVPLEDVNNMHLMVGGRTEAAFLKDPAFSQQQGAGDTGVSTQIRGTLGRKYGYEVFANQNTPDYAPSISNNNDGAFGAAVSRGDMTIDVGGLATTNTYVAGTIIQAEDTTNSRDGRKQRFVTAADFTTNGSGAATGIPVVEPAIFDIPDASALNVFAVVATPATHELNCGFHRNFAAFAMARLPDTAALLPGVNVASVQDEDTGLAMRSRLFYEGNNSKVFVALDILYGTKLLDGNLGARMPVDFTT